MKTNTAEKIIYTQLSQSIYCCSIQ